MKLKLEATGRSDMKRIMRGDQFVAMAVQYTSDLWGVHDADDRKVIAPVYKTPTKAMRAWEALRG